LQFVEIRSTPRKNCLAPPRGLHEFAIRISNMKKYIFIVMSAALLAACEQKTETTEPAVTPAPTSPPATTETSPAATTESPAATTESPAATAESPSGS
jgi:hypothetical protein